MPLSRQTVIGKVLKLQNRVNQTHTLKKGTERQNQPSKQKMFVCVRNYSLVYISPVISNSANSNTLLF